MLEILRNKKISGTSFRKDVLSIFMKYENAIPLSVVENELGKFDRITLYRTIKLFLEKGIIHKITISGEEPSYAICQEECSAVCHHHQHIHFKCTGCGEISCIEMDEFPSIKLPTYKIEELEIQAIGLCQSCNI